MPKTTPGEMEDALARAIIQFEKEQLDRVPLEARAFLIEDMALIRLRGVLTPAEVRLAQSPDGQALIKEMRRQLLESSRSLLEEIVMRVTGCAIVSLHTDISTRTGERIIVFTLPRRRARPQPEASRGSRRNPNTIA